MQRLLQVFAWVVGVLLLADAAAKPQVVQAGATSGDVVRIAAEDNWPPFSDEAGLGLSQQLVQAALAASGYRLDIVPMPYARALRETAQGDVDACWNVTRQQSTLDSYVLHQTPLFKAQASYYFRDTVKPYKSVADFPDNTLVGVIIGYEYGDLYEQHKQRFKLVEVSTHAQLIQLLVAGKIEVAIFFDDVLAYYLRQPQFQALNLLRGQPNHVSEIFVAFSKKQPRSVELAAALDRGLRILKKNGSYQRLTQQYLVPNAAQKSAKDQK